MPSTQLRKQWMSSVRHMVVKVGTAVLTGDSGRLNKAIIARIGEQLAELRRRGIRVTLVTSGAVGAGMGLTGQARRPRSLPVLQATAAVGQPALMALYGRVFARHGLLAGQVLVTRKDFEERSRYVNISNTLAALHRLGAVPVINENDTTAIDELDRYADNDIIAALVTNLLRADLLVILSVVDGLLNAEGQRVDLVPQVCCDVEALVRGDRSSLGSGGMASKLGAARLVTEAGECVVIADGRQPGVLLRLIAGERIGTVFAPAPRKLTAKHRWIAGAARPVGRIDVDAGAAEAVLLRGKSLLAKGITAVSGDFPRGAIVRVVSPDGIAFAHGLSNYSAAELARIKGLKSSEFAEAIGECPFEEAIHRDNLVLTLGRT